jgi:hypothetical protein
MQPLTLNTVNEPTMAACSSQTSSVRVLVAATAPIDDDKPKSETTEDTLITAKPPSKKNYVAI